MLNRDCMNLGAMGLRRGAGYWNGGVPDPISKRSKSGTAILVSAQMKHNIVANGIITPERAQWFICSVGKEKIGYLNLYAPNEANERASFWREVANKLPTADSWVVGGDFNMVESESDRSNETKKKITVDEQHAWDCLIFMLGLEDTWVSDDYTHYNSLRFSWSNKQPGEPHRLARLDRFYVGEWGSSRGGTIEILDGHGTLSDHLPVVLKIRRKSHFSDAERQFRFNTSFLADVAVTEQLVEAWNEEPRPTSGADEWSVWVADALERVKFFCQGEGKRRADERRKREKQLRVTVASAERLLQAQPHDEFLHARLEAASQELLEKEQREVEWASIRASARWAQIEGRMNGEFYAEVGEANSNTPIQFLRDTEGQEYITNDEMAGYANSYCQELFRTQREDAECLAARKLCWSAVPRKVTEEMNAILTKEVTSEELHTAIKALPSGNIRKI